MSRLGESYRAYIEDTLGLDWKRERRNYEVQTVNGTDQLIFWNLPQTAPTPAQLQQALDNKDLKRLNAYLDDVTEQRLGNLDARGLTQYRLVAMTRRGATPGGGRPGEGGKLDSLEAIIDASDAIRADLTPSTTETDIDNDARWP